MLFLTDPKYNVRIVRGLRNHFPNTMFGGVLFWTLIEVLLRNMRSLHALWRQKTPLTNGHVQEAKTHCRKIDEAWLQLGWKSTPWFHCTGAHCGAVLQKYRNLYVFIKIPAEHRHKPFKLAVESSMRGRCLRRQRVTPRGLTWRPLTWGCDTERPGKGLPLARPQRTEEKGTACTLEKRNLNPVHAFGALMVSITWHTKNTPPKQPFCHIYLVVPCAH